MQARSLEIVQRGRLGALNEQLHPGEFFSARWTSGEVLVHLGCGGVVELTSDEGA
jgi:hypothetical protein